MNVPSTTGANTTMRPSAQSSDASSATSFNVPLKNALSTLTDVLKRGGPRPDEYGLVDRAFQQLHESGIGPRALEPLFASTLLPDCIHGWAALQPLGYAGDHVVIDRIYTRFTSDESHLRSWDQFCQAQPAANAVRNRKDVFLGLLRELAERSDEAAVLNVGSGPARDISEFLTSTSAQGVHFTCVDNDSHAIAYASRLCGETPRVRFIHANALRFRPDRPYDLVWSGGLFDYLNDRHFTRLATRLYKSLKPSGVLVIGNFNAKNPSRPLMELLLKWHLNHRNPEQLRTLARSIGVAPHCVSIDAEPEGINLFLRLRASAHA